MKPLTDCRKTLACATFGISAALLVGGIELQQAEQRSRANEAQTRLNRQHATARQAASEAAARRDDAELLITLQRTGRLAGAEIADWREHLGHWQAALPIERLDYEFTSAPGTDGPLRRQHLKLSAEVVHETALLALLDRLREDSPGLVLLRRCTLTTAPAGLQGECDADWITR